jgi:hypothetical protein
MTSLQAWTSAEIGGRDGFTLMLTPAQVAEIERLVEATRDLAPDAITRARFSSPAIDALMAEVKARVQHGHGAVILSGLPMDGRSLEDFTRLHWGLGAHLGRNVIQNVRRDLIVEVKAEPDSPTGVTADFELKPHSEFHELLSLATYSLPASGGVSGLVSGLALYDYIARTRPDVLPALYEGYWQVSPVRRTMSDGPVPVFSRQDGVLSVFYNRLFQGRAAEARGEELPAAYREALAVFTAAAEDPVIAANFVLQPGAAAVLEQLHQPAQPVGLRRRAGPSPPAAAPVVAGRDRRPAGGPGAERAGRRGGIRLRQRLRRTGDKIGHEKSSD